MSESSSILNALINHSITVDEVQAASTISAYLSGLEDLEHAEQRANVLIKNISFLKAVAQSITATGFVLEGDYDTNEKNEDRLRRFEKQLEQVLLEIRELNLCIEPLRLQKAAEDKAKKNVQENLELTDNAEQHSKQVIIDEAISHLRKQGHVMSAAQLTLKIYHWDKVMSSNVYRKRASDVGSILLKYTKKGKLMRTNEIIPNTWVYGLPEWWNETGELRTEFSPTNLGKR